MGYTKEKERELILRFMTETFDLEFLTSCDDRALIQHLRNSTENALAVLVSRYMRVVRAKARSCFINGYETEDIVQEGLIGFLQAVENYDLNSDCSFYTYAGACIDNRIRKAMQYANTNKFKALNRSVSIDDLLAEEELNDASATPEEIVIVREQLDAVKTGVDTLLSDLERDVLLLYLNGEDYHQISQKLGVSPKAVDNALQRVRRKLKRV